MKGWTRWEVEETVIKSKWGTSGPQRSLVWKRTGQSGGGVEVRRRGPRRGPMMQKWECEKERVRLKVKVKMTLKRGEALPLESCVTSRQARSKEQDGRGFLHQNPRTTKVISAICSNKREECCCICDILS